MYNKNQITGQALATLNEFIKYADNMPLNVVKFEKPEINNEFEEFKIRLENEKQNLYDLVEQLELNLKDIQDQIQHAESIITGIEYVQNYLIKRSNENNM